MNENKIGTEAAENSALTDAELDELITDGETEDVEVCKKPEKRSYRATPKKQREPHEDDNSRLIATTSAVTLIFTVIMALSMLIIANLHISFPKKGQEDTDGTGGPSLPVNSFVGTVDSDYRERPNLPSHKNAEESSAYKPTGSSYSEMKGIYADHAILVDAGTGSIMYGNGVDDRVQIASMTKVMTLIVACDYITDDSVMYRGVKLKYDPKMDGYATCYISTSKPDYYEETVYVIDLLYGLILESGADCAYGLAEGLAGSEDAFVKKMNEKAAAIGMTDSHFTNCVGKDDGGKNYSTMRDVATMFAYALENDLCRAVLTSESWVAVGDYEYLHGSTGYLSVKAIVYTGIRKRKSNMVCGNVTVLGGKSGSEDLAGYCLVSVARSSDGREYICVTSGAENGQQYDDAVYIYSNYVK